MKPILLILFLIFFTTFYSPIYAHPLFVSLSKPTIEKNELNLIIEDFRKPIDFFYGHQKEIHFKNIGLNYSKRTAYFMEYDFSLLMLAADIAGRKTISKGHGVRIGVSRDIWGDMLVMPLWKWQLGIEGVILNFRDFNGYQIDMDYKSASLNLSLYCSKSIYFFTGYIGVNFYYSVGEFTENINHLKHLSLISGVSLFGGLRVQPYRNFFIQAGYSLFNKKGYFISSGIAF